MIVKKQVFGYLIPGLLGLFLILSACTKEKVVNVDPVCFENDVLPIITANCTYSTCHNSTDRAEGLELISYADIVSTLVTPGNYKTSKLYQVLISSGSDRMPKKPYSRLTAEQIGTIALWIDQGAGNTSCDQNTCDVSKVTYSSTVKPLLDRHCNSCHAGSAPSGNIDLSSHAGVKKYALDGSLFGSINHDPGFVRMPDGAAKLPACDISSIKEWIRLGALNN